MKLNKIAAAVALAGAMIAGQANAAYLLDWYLDSNGATNGTTDASLVQEYVDLVGSAYIQNAFNGAVAPGTTFSFTEAGLFGSATTDGGPFGGLGGVNLATTISSQFLGTGTGTVGTGFNFSTGTLDIFSGATKIGSFVLTAGEGTLANSSLVPNGTVSLVFQATMLEQGYFYRDGTFADDLYDNTADGLLFGFVSVNASTRDLGFYGDGLANFYNANFDTRDAAANNGTTDLWIGNNGQFRLSTVPEPGSLALLGLGLLGLGAARRRKA